VVLNEHLELVDGEGTLDEAMACAKELFPRCVLAVQAMTQKLPTFIPTRYTTGKFLSVNLEGSDECVDLPYQQWWDEYTKDYSKAVYVCCNSKYGQSYKNMLA